MFDQLDSGKSDQLNDPKNWRVERFFEFIETIRMHLGVKQWHLVGIVRGQHLLWNTLLNIHNIQNLLYLAERLYQHHIG